MRHRAVCLFTPQLLLILTAPTHGGMARLSWQLSLRKKTVIILLVASTPRDYDICTSISVSCTLFSVKTFSVLFSLCARLNGQPACQFFSANHASYHIISYQRYRRTDEQTYRRTDNLRLQYRDLHVHRAVKPQTLHAYPWCYQRQNT